MRAGEEKLTFEKSRLLHHDSKKVIPGGVNSNVRMGEKPHPIFFEASEGPYLYDVDGNRLIDYVMGQGPMLLGHRPAFVIAAVEEQLGKGILYGAQHALEVEVAQLITRTVPSAEVVRFNMTGTEAVQAALRIARAATGRNAVLKFEGHYHGWADSVLFNVGSGSQTRSDGRGTEPVPESAGVATDAAGSLIVAPWNDPEALDGILSTYGDEVAAVIMEPVMANSGVVEPRPGYLEAVRRMCDRHGIVLIFDEVITGFRAGLGGAQGRYGVIPDLTTMGKALASGFPCGLRGGSAGSDGRHRYRSHNPCRHFQRHPGNDGRGQGDPRTPLRARRRTVRPHGGARSAPHAGAERGHGRPGHPLPCPRSAHHLQPHVHRSRRGPEPPRCAADRQGQAGRVPPASHGGRGTNIGIRQLLSVGCPLECGDRRDYRTLRCGNPGFPFGVVTPGTCIRPPSHDMG